MNSRISFGSVSRQGVSQRRGREPESGFALILTLLVLMLLIAIVKPLIFEVQRESQVTNYGRADLHLRFAAREAFLEALDVLEQEFSQDGGMGGAGGAMGGLGDIMGAGGDAGVQGMDPLGGAGGEEEAEPPHDSFNSESLRYHRRKLDQEDLDEIVPNWVISESANSQSYERDNIRVKSFIYIEDENRKLNILELAHKDEEVRQRAGEQLERLLDWMVDDRSQAGLDAEMDIEMFIEAVSDWITLRADQNRALDADVFTRPELLSNESEDEARARESGSVDKTTLPLTLRELRQAVADRVSMPEDFWVDRLDQEKILRPGLESLLTVCSALTEEPIEEDEYGNWIPEEEAQEGRRTSAASPRVASPLPSESSGASSSTSSEPAEDALGLVNLNTASWAVLRAISPPEEIPDAVIDAIFEYRNEVDEEKLEKQREQKSEESASDQYRSETDVMTGMEGDEYEPLKVFSTLQDLEKVEDFKALDPEYKAKFTQYLGVESDVFSIWVTVIARPTDQDEEDLSEMFGEDPEEYPIEERWLDIKTGEIVRRYRKVVWRRPASDGLSAVEFLSIIPLEVRNDRKFALQEDPEEYGF